MVAILHPERCQLVTAQIFYWMPKPYSHLIQTFVWQKEDIWPEYPELRKFLRFWQKNLDGKLRRVEFAGRALDLDMKGVRIAAYEGTIKGINH